MQGGLRRTVGEDEEGLVARGQIRERHLHAAAHRARRVLERRADRLHIAVPRLRRLHGLAHPALRAAAKVRRGERAVQRRQDVDRKVLREDPSHLVAQALREGVDVQAGLAGAIGAEVVVGAVLVAGVNFLGAGVDQTRVAVVDGGAQCVEDAAAVHCANQSYPIEKSGCAKE